MLKYVSAHVPEVLCFISIICFLFYVVVVVFHSRRCAVVCAIRDKRFIFHIHFFLFIMIVEHSVHSHICAAFDRLFVTAFFNKIIRKKI